VPSALFRRQVELLAQAQQQGKSLYWDLQQDGHSQL